MSPSSSSGARYLHPRLLKHKTSVKCSDDTASAPTRGHIVRQIALSFRVDCARKAEIAELQGTVTHRGGSRGGGQVEDTLREWSCVLMRRFSGCRGGGVSAMRRRSTRALCAVKTFMSRCTTSCWWHHSMAWHSCVRTYLKQSRFKICLAQLVDQAAHELAVEAGGLFLQNFKQVLLHVLEHEVSAGS